MFSVHALYLAEQLAKNGISVSLFLYCPPYVYEDKFCVSLIRKAKRDFKVYELKPTFFERNLTRLNAVTSKLVGHSALLLGNPLLPTRTRTYFRPEDYDLIITVNEHSLYWLHLTYPAALSSTLHYTLEVNKVTDPYNEPKGNVFIKKEADLLRHVQGLIVQDKFRGDALMEGVSATVKRFYLPVSVPGEAIKEKTSFLYEKLGIAANKDIILYFGSVYKERLLHETLAVFKSKASEHVLVLHGPDNFKKVSAETENIRFSQELLEYEDISLLISSAKIGLAIYDNSWPNSRYTAFSSEKIARYLQCGVPFIALNNESYRKLREEFQCCELLDNIDELHNAITKILDNYPAYAEASYQAFEKYYKLDFTVMPLVDYIKSRE